VTGDAGTDGRDLAANVTGVTIPVDAGHVLLDGINGIAVMGGAAMSGTADATG
jgi:hypothetical protein